MKSVTIYSWLIACLGIILLASCSSKGQPSNTKAITAAQNDTLSEGETPYAKQIVKRRADFKHELLHTDSILNQKEQATIKKMRYFPIDTTWIIQATFKADTGAIFNMPTSSDRSPEYKQIGWVNIHHQTDSFRLAVYQSIELNKKPKFRHLAFIPFVDGNSPKLTYGGGRYMEFDILPGAKEVEIDFNKCINPYCAYSYNYSCPITPKINHISVDITAGAMNPIKTY